MTDVPDFQAEVLVMNNVTINGSVSITGTVTVTGTVSISGTVTVTGTVAISGTVTVTGTVSISGSVTITGTVSISGSVTVTGTVAISGSVTITGSVSITNATLNVTVGNTVIATGQAGPAIGMDGVGDKITVAHHANISPTTEDFSIALEIKVLKFSGNPNLWDKGVIPGSGIALQLTSAGQLNFYTAQAAAYQGSATAAGVVSLATKATIHVTRDGADVYIYVNGADVTSSHGTHVDPAANTGSLTLGQSVGGGVYFNGIMYWVRYWKGKALTASEVATDYANPTQPIQEGLEMWLKFAEGVGTSLADATGNAHTGTLTGGTWVSALGSVPAAIAINVQASQIDMPISVDAQTVDITILAPTGKMVSIGDTLASSSSLTQVGLAADTENVIFTVTGRGKLSHLAWLITGYDNEDDMGRSDLKIYIDGAPYWQCTFEQLDQTTGGNQMMGQMAATATVYWAKVANPAGGLIYAKTRNTVASDMNEHAGFLNIPFEYTTSISVRVRTQTGDVGYCTMLGTYGAYV